MRRTHWNYFIMSHNVPRNFLNWRNCFSTTTKKIIFCMIFTEKVINSFLIVLNLIAYECMKWWLWNTKGFSPPDFLLSLYLIIIFLFPLYFSFNQSTFLLYLFFFPLWIRILWKSNKMSWLWMLKNLALIETMRDEEFNRIKWTFTVSTFELSFSTYFIWN